MSQNLQLKRSEKSFGDTAVDGLLVGIVAGIGMLAYLIIAGWVAGENPLVIINRFDIAGGGSWLVALIAHLAVSGIYGLLFALLFKVLVRFRIGLMRLGWLWGIIYGLALYGLAQGAFFAGIDSPLQQFAAVNLLLAHGLYGLLLGAALGRHWNIGR